MQVTGAQAIVETLVRHGVDTLFGIPGAQTYGLFDALAGAQNRIRTILPRHEQAAAYMAYGYAKSTGRLGVFSVVPGPGLLNTAAALCTAQGATAPVMAITSQVPSTFIGKGRGHLHELPDQLGTVRSFIKWAERISHPRQAPGIVSEAIRQALTGRAGATAVEMPWDVMPKRANVDFDHIPMACEADLSQPDMDEIERAAALIKEAKAPMIMVGGGALHAGAEILELAELLGAPAVSHRGGRGIVAEDHPLGMPGYPASKLWAETDLLIGIGTRLELAYLRWGDQAVERPRPAHPKVIRIDIDPTEMIRVAPDVPVVADAKLGTRALVDMLRSNPGAWVSREEACLAAKAEAETEYESRMQPQTDYLRAIRQVLPRDGFFIEELSQMGFASWVAFPVYEARHYVSSGAQGTLGFGFMTALGVKVANPDKCVVSVTGDGGLMFGIQELATAAENRIGLVTVVVNNGSYENVRRDQEQIFKGRVYKAEFKSPDFKKLAEGFGVAHYHAASPDELRKALEAAFAQSDQPALIEIPSAPGREATPWPFLHPFA